MTESPDTPASVGRQLKARREELDLTQGALAQLIGINSTTVSITERGLTQIQLSRRPAWERALRLAPGTISQAYKTGAPLTLDESPAEPPYANMSDPKEAAVWGMSLPEADRREIIDAVRAAARQGTRRRA